LPRFRRRQAAAALAKSGMPPVNGSKCGPAMDGTETPAPTTLGRITERT